MTARDNGGLAFPLAHEIQPEPGAIRSFSIHSGMTLRDYFAGQVINGLMAHHGYYQDDAFDQPKKYQKAREYAMTFDIAAEYAYGQAAAMLAERAKGGDA